LQFQQSHARSKEFVRSLIGIATYIRWFIHYESLFPVADYD
jgi:hypothetical protein